MSRRRISVLISGRVQRVGFRFFALEEARRLGIVGYVRNTPEGRVEVLAEGEESALRMLLDLLGSGPRAARVEGIDVSWGDPTDCLSDFRVET